jgi:hypothetical protein
VLHYGEKEMGLLKRGINLLMAGFFLEVIVLCLITSYNFIGIESMIMLLIFNFLFVSLTFGLNGKLTRKLGLLSLGNVIGLFWDFTLLSIATSGNAYFGGTFTTLFRILHPFLNFVWMISFWSISLSALPNPKSNNVEVQT